MIIEVTQDDIDQGVRQTPSSCPIARAASRAFGEPYWATYYGLEPAGSDITYYSISDATGGKMAKYDLTGKMTPFRFRATKRKYL